MAAPKAYRRDDLARATTHSLDCDCLLCRAVWPEGRPALGGVRRPSLIYAAALRRKSTNGVHHEEVKP